MDSEQAWEQDKATFRWSSPSADPTAVTWVGGSWDTGFRCHRGDFGPLAAQFAWVAALLFGSGTAAAVLDTVVHAGVTLVPEANWVSITLRKGATGFETPATVNELAVRIDRIQYDCQEGPCIDATRGPAPGIVVEPDLAVSTQWPRFGPAAAALGVGSVMSFGLSPATPAPRLGALNFYASQQRVLLGLDHDIGLLLAAHAGAVLTAARSVEAAETRAANLERALVSRDVIGQAKGMLMMRRGISAEEAFAVLRATSHRLNVRLAVLAAAIVEHRVEL